MRDRLKSLLRVSEENEHLRSVLEQVGVQDGGPAPAPAADDGRADALQEELRSARQELNSATEARYGLEKELVKTQDALKAARSERVSLRELQEATALAASQAAALQAENERLQARLRAPAESAELARVSGENGRLAQELASAGRRVAALEAALEEAHHRSTALQAELDGSEREAGRLEAQLREAEEAAALAEAKLRELDGDGAREQAAWLQRKLESAHEQVAQLQARDRELERSLRDAWPAVSEMDRIVLALTRELEQRRAEQEAAARETALLRSELDGLREQAADTERQVWVDGRGIRCKLARYLLRLHARRSRQNVHIRDGHAFKLSRFFPPAFAAVQRAGRQAAKRGPRDGSGKGGGAATASKGGEPFPGADGFATAARDGSCRLAACSWSGSRV